MSIAASFLTAFAFVSCSDDLAGYFHSGNNMRFALSESNWSNAGKTRSADVSGGQEYNTAVLALCDKSSKDVVVDEGGVELGTHSLECHAMSIALTK